MPKIQLEIHSPVQNKPDLAALSLTACVALVCAAIAYCLLAPHTPWLRWDRLGGLALCVGGLYGVVEWMRRLGQRRGG